MSDMDLNTLSLPELKRLEKDLAKATASFTERRKNEAMAELEARAKELAFTLADFAGQQTKKGKRASAGPKYKHPENPEVTWSVRGSKPRWFADALASGKSPKSMEI